ncbi:MAG: glycosyltransferase family 39 protein [Proteobacteria bacterium]|nr:glycosyltransferase family 39 protein [Pseudomonadota bacterium]
MIDEIKKLSENKKVILLLTGLTILAFIVRLYSVLSAQVITPDGIQYIEVAKMIASGSFQKISTFSFFNLYPFLIVVFQKVFHDWEMAGRLVSALLSSLAVVPFFLLIRELIGNRIAFMASLFYIIGPRLVEYSSDVLREPSFWFFSITSLYCAWSGITRKRWIFLVLASLFVGMATFTRFEGVALVLIILLWMIWYCLDGGMSVKNLFVMMFVFIISFPLIASPFLFALKNNLGKWEFGLVGEKLPRLILVRDVDQDLELKPELINTIPSHFRNFFDMAARHKYEIYFSEGIYKFAKSLHVMFFILFLFGVIKRKYIPYNKGEIPFLIWILVFFLSIYVYMVKMCYLSTRHGLLVGIPALVWASIGFFELKERIAHLLSKGSRTFLDLSRHTTGLLLIMILIIVLPNTLASSGGDKIELKKAGVYLKELGYSKARFAGDHSLYRVAFYADAEFVTIPVRSDYKTFNLFVKENKADYVMIDERTINTYIPDLKENLDPAKFEKVSLPQLENFQEYSIVVYKIKDKQ